MPDQTGRTIIVTGANNGIGYEATKALAQKGAHVVMACRSLEKANRARQQIESTVGDASLSILELDLANQASIQRFASEFNSEYDQLDVLINNAGVLSPQRLTTDDGFERMFGVNHLGHFTLTELLLDKLLETDGETRIVVQSSNTHKGAELDFDDLQHEQSFSQQDVYGQSKLANLLFTYELDRRLRSIGAEAIAVAAHPGWSGTGLLGGEAGSGLPRVQQRITRAVDSVFSQSAAAGALPVLYAATANDVDGGQYFGPSGFMEMRGSPARTVASRAAYDPEDARRLWEISEELTGTRYTFSETIIA